MADDDKKTENKDAREQQAEDKANVAKAEPDAGGTPEEKAKMAGGNEDQMAATAGDIRSMTEGGDAVTTNVIPPTDPFGNPLDPVEVTLHHDAVGEISDAEAVKQAQEKAEQAGQIQRIQGGLEDAPKKGLTVSENPEANAALAGMSEREMHFWRQGNSISGAQTLASEEAEREALAKAAKSDK